MIHLGLPILIRSPGQPGRPERVDALVRVLPLGLQEPELEFPDVQVQQVDIREQPGEGPRYDSEGPAAGPDPFFSAVSSWAAAAGGTPLGFSSADAGVEPRLLVKVSIA